MDAKNCVDERWLVSEDASEDEDEALSLSDLPLINQWRKENKNDDDDHNNYDNALLPPQDQEFDFCSLSRESEMCAADEVFFKGQILPLRHSVSSEKGLLQNYDDRRRSCSISRSDSMDHSYSSRSSSISSSGTSSSSATAARYKPKLPPRIQFHSHPSPSPRLHFPSNRHGGATAANHRNSSKKSSIWNVLRLGLVAAPPEIAFHDLKARNGNSGSRRSTSSNSTSGGCGEKKKKTRPRILGGGCRCAADAVDTIAAPKVVIIKRSASDGDVRDHRSATGVEKLAAAKKHLSHHRTFEWLKQLSVEGGAADQS